MIDSSVGSAVSDSISTIRMLIEPRYIRKVTESTVQSCDELKRKVDSYVEPAAISNGCSFVCNKPYSDLLRAYNCPESIMGAYQLENIQKVLVSEKIDCNSICDSIDYDVLMKIIDKIRFVSEEVLIKAWGKLLKNEIESQSKYCMRTVERLSCLSSEEAILFERRKGSIFWDRDGNYFFLTNSNSGSNEILDRSILMEAGLIGYESLTITNGTLFWNQYCVKTTGVVSVYKITTFGCDIYGLMDFDLSLSDCEKELMGQKKLKSWSIHSRTNEHGCGEEVLSKYPGDDASVM